MNGIVLFKNKSLKIEMSVKEANLSADVFAVCLTHAMSTEKEEIMGLLIGEIDEHSVCFISAVILLRRSDKQADRVEISPEQLSAASSRAEELSQMLDRPMRVIGWYHSHPHITVWPSHIDVQTQAAYQLMDDGFIGVIFSVFNQEKATNKSRVEVACFQSAKHGVGYDNYERVEIPLHIEPVDFMSEACVQSLAELATIIEQEEEESYKRTLKVLDLDLTVALQNEAVLTKNMMQIFEILVGPLMAVFESRIMNNETTIEKLHKEKEELREKLKQLALQRPYSTTSV